MHWNRPDADWQFTIIDLTLIGNAFDYFTGVFPLRRLVDSWSREPQYVVILHRLQYHYIKTWGAIWRVWLLRAYVNQFIWDTADVVLKQTDQFKGFTRKMLSKSSCIVSYNKTDMALWQWDFFGSSQNVLLYDCSVSSTPLVDSLSRGRQYVVILHWVLYHYILTQDAIWLVW